MANEVTMTGPDLQSRPATIADLAPMLAAAKHTASLYAHRGPEDFYRVQALAHVNDLAAQVAGLEGAATSRTIAGPAPHTRCPEGWRPARTPDPELEAAAVTCEVFGRILEARLAEWTAAAP